MLFLAILDLSHVNPTQKHLCQFLGYGLYLWKVKVCSYALSNFIGFCQVHRAAMAVSAFSKVGDIDDDDEAWIVTDGAVGCFVSQEMSRNPLNEKGKPPRIDA